LPAPVGPAQRRELPATLLKLEPKPISAYDDNPVFDEAGAARFVGVTADCLKKWRHRKQGLATIQTQLQFQPAANASFGITGASVTVVPGATAGNTSIVSVTPAGGFIGSVALTAAVTSSPADAQYQPTLSFGATTPVSIKSE